MKKSIAALLLVSLLLGCLSLAAAEDVPAGEVHTEGRLSAFVPEGWTVYPVEVMNPQGIKDIAAFSIVINDEKRGQYATPAVEVNYFPNMSGDNFMGGEERMEITPFELGGYTWSGIRYVSWGTRFYRLYTTGDFEGIILISISEFPGTESSYPIPEDPAIRAILSSITLSPK